MGQLEGKLGATMAALALALACHGAKANAQTAGKAPMPSDNSQQTAPNGQSSTPTNQTPPSRTTAPAQKDDRVLQTAKTIFDIFSKERAKQKAKQQANQPAPVAPPPSAPVPDPVPEAAPAPAPVQNTPTPAARPRYVQPTANVAPTKIVSPPRAVAPITQPAPAQISATTSAPSPSSAPAKNIAPPPTLKTPKSATPNPASQPVAAAEPVPTGNSWLWLIIAALAVMAAAIVTRLFLFPKPKYAVAIDSDDTISTIPSLHVEAPESRFDVRYEWGVASAPSLKLEG